MSSLAGSKTPDTRTIGESQPATSMLSLILTGIPRIGDETSAETDVATVSASSMISQTHQPPVSGIDGGLPEMSFHWLEGVAAPAAHQVYQGAKEEDRFGLGPEDAIELPANAPASSLYDS
ncbi:unnamed protein product [Mesocestoides corti]|uniref:Uncharacterized protein n=1 Tax=Mesocestoides corti TaxID=53468 RepID=A0A3P6H9Q8_MESCO|nr:unnamed protein product [Mesocestoides corti]